MHAHIFSVDFTHHIQTQTRASGYSRITSTKSPLFCLTTFSAGLTNLTTLLPQSHDCSR